MINVASFHIEIIKNIWGFICKKNTPKSLKINKILRGHLTKYFCLKTVFFLFLKNYCAVQPLASVTKKP